MVDEDMVGNKCFRRGCPPPGCCGPCYQPCCGPCCPPCSSPCCPPVCRSPCAEEKPTSFNNCNFYCSELPNGIKVGGGNNNCCVDPMCIEEEPCGYQSLNQAAGDDQLAPVPRSGTSSSAPSSSRHGGSSIQKTSSVSSKKRTRGQRKSSRESVEEYEDVYTHEDSRKTGSSMGKGSSITYSYSKSEPNRKTVVKQKIQKPQISSLYPKTGTKRDTNVNRGVSQAKSQYESCSSGKKYSIFAKGMSPALYGTNLAKGDVDSDKQVGYFGNSLNSDTETKLKLGEVILPEPVKGQMDSQRPYCRDHMNLKEKEDELFNQKRPVAGESIKKIACNSMCADDPAQLGPYLEAVTKSSEFSTNKIFGPSAPRSVSSATVCAPATIYTSSTHAGAAHDSSHQGVMGSKPGLRRCKSVDGLQKPSGKPAGTSSSVLKIVADTGKPFCRQQGLYSLLKMADEIQQKLIPTKRPICVVMTGLTDRAKAKNEKKTTPLCLSQSSETKDFLATGVTSDFTRCGTDHGRPAVNQDLERLVSKRVETAIPPPATSSGMTMKSFFSSGAIALPPSRRWDLKTAHPSASTSANVYTVHDDGGKQTPTPVLPRLPLSGDGPYGAKGFSMQVSSSDGSTKRQINFPSNFGPNIHLPQWLQPSYSKFTLFERLFSDTASYFFLSSTASHCRTAC